MVGDFARELEKRCQEEPDQAPIVPAVRMLLNFVKDTNYGSVQELQVMILSMRFICNIRLKFKVII